WTPAPASLAPLIHPLGNRITTIDSALNDAYPVSIALGADGLPVMSYYDNVNGNLKVAKCANAACAGGATITVVDSAGIVGLQTSITVGTDGFPVVSYIHYVSAANFWLKVAKCANTACTGAATITTVDNFSLRVGAFNKIMLGADGIPV